MVRRRWDVDERGQGIASGAAFAGQVEELLELMADPGWVTEEPELHLLPHLRSACDEPGSPLRLDDARSEGDVFVVELSTTASNPSVGHVRRAAVALAAAIAEESTNIRQRRVGELLEFDVATGSTRESRFAPHGHLVRFRIRTADGR